MRLRDHFREVMTARSDTSGRLPFLVNDMVIEEQLCQMRCAYCLTEEYNLLMNVPDAQVRLTTDRRADWHAVLDAYHANVDSPILRLSGGEFFWLRGSTEFIAECSKRYETVQVITNGVFLKPERLDALAALGNCQLNISLDGHTLELNRYRLPPRQAKLHPVIMQHLDDAVARAIPVEIQSVLTDLNADGQLAFCEFLRERYDGRVMLFFFPVRGDTAKDMSPSRSDHLDPILERWDEFSGVLPPRAYVEHMNDQMRAGTRSLSCFITATMVQLFGNGEVSVCPHEWIKPIGNLRTDRQLISEQYARHQHYDLFLQDTPRFSVCKGCATPSDVLNLYFLGRISDDEMARCRLYSGPRSAARLRELREMFRPIVALVAAAG